ncbi:MAG: hypothetical protein GY822_18390 [Deltaproteobacteria bacterium]|nr:hypothetical protein [Deltaproteobacteria bacterium]
MKSNIFRIFLGFTTAAMVFLVACGPTEPTSCEEAACDGRGNYCQFHGSDVVYESSSASCVDVPQACVDDVSCECIHGDDFGECSLEEGVVWVVIPADEDGPEKSTGISGG